MSFKGHVLKGWSSGCGAIGRWWNLQKAGPNRRKLGQWGYDSEGAIWILAPPLSLSASCPPYSEQSLLLYAPTTVLYIAATVPR